jgi:peptide/nickel transport system substrate-binding protein
MKAAPVLLAVGLACFSACTRSGDASIGRHPWTHAGVLRIALSSEPKTLNALLTSTTTDEFVDRLMFEPLISADARGNPVPILTTSVPSQANGAISADGLTITYRLRPDARWSDGVPVSAGDVRWSWQAIMNGRNDVVSRHGYDDVERIETPDARTVVVHLKKPFAPFVNTFFAESDQPYDVLPAHVLARYGDINHLAFNANPAVSDGPFRIVAWKRGDRLLLDANPAFFEGRPGLTRIEIAFVPNEDTAINLLRTHAIDYIFQPSIQTFTTLRSIPATKVVWVNANGFEGMAFNLAHPALADPLVRRAIAAALDKTALTRQLAFGQVTTATEDLPNWIWAFDPSVRSVPFDPSAAKALLARAGWIAGSDGLVRKGGRTLQLLLATDTQTATHRSESLLVQAALQRIGIPVEVKYYPQDVLYAPEAMGGIQHGGKFDLLLYGWYAGIDPDNSSQFTCENQPPQGYDDSRYCSPAMQTAQHAALARYDRPSRIAAYASIEGLLAADNPVIFFWWQRQQEALSVDFHGFDPNPVLESWNAWKWSI